MNLFGQILGKHYKGFVLALAGGGGRGLAHLGAIKALEENGLRPDAIVGTSIGALFGAMYALNPDAETLRRRVFEFLNSDTFHHLNLPKVNDMGVESTDESWLARLSSVARQTILYTRALTDIAVADDSTLTQIAAEFCGEGGFETAKIALHVTAVHFPGGECKVFSSGNLCKALAASMAVPGVFDPVEIDGMRYLDGGLASEVPAMEARSVAGEDRFVVAVNTGARPDPEHAPTNVMGMLDWSSQVKSLYLRQYEKAHADVLIEPLVSYTQWDDFSNSDDEVGRGYEATLEKIPEIHRLLGS